MSLSTKILALSLAVAPLALLPAPVLAQAPTTAVTQRLATTQLPRTAKPLHYAITITPDAANLRFAGSTAITVDIYEKVSSLTLNAADITFKSVSIKGKRGKAIKGTAAVDAAAQTATLSFAKPLKPGQYTLSIDYDGVISTQANGLFALDYKDNAGVQQRALFTQMEAPDARRFVPSWDEPSYKATFDLRAIVPAAHMAVGNMPIIDEKPLADGLKQVSFATTPKMSSYLLFFGLGDLERATKMSGKTELGVITGKGNSGKAQFALDGSAELLPWFNDYFGVEYPLPKLDNVAGPGQSQFFSAMENWGAIFTFERALLIDPRFTTEATKRRIYETVAHEMAHQWFGNIVTMSWWDDLWLNEGFASWMATKVTDRFKPEWQMLLTRVGGREAAMGLDSFVTTHPVIQKIETVEQTNQAFDAIAYQKGEAVITMLEAFAGEDVWRTGIRAYMKTHAYGNTVTDDLWQAVESAGAKGLVSVAHDFTKQPGIPLVTVSSALCAGGVTTLLLEQGEFSRDRPGKVPLSWNVPVIAQTIGGAEQRMVLSGGKGRITLPGCGAYVINTGQTGYYRSLYPAENLTALGKSFARLPVIDQMGLLADNWQLGQAGYQPIERALDLLDAVPAGASEAVQVTQVGYLEALYEGFGDDSANAAKVATYAGKKLLPALTAMGYDPRPTDSAQTPILRQELVGALGAMGNPVVVAEARRRFDLLATDPAALDGPLKNIWLGIVAANADQATWTRLRAMANAATAQLERADLFGLLGAAKDKALASQALTLALTDEPGKTTSARILGTVASNHSMMAVDFALANLKTVEALVDSSARSRVIAGLAAGSADLAMIDKLDAYAKANLATESRKPVDQSIVAIRNRAETRAKQNPAIASWIAARK